MTYGCITLAINNDAKYMEAQGRLSEAVYITSGLQDNLNKYTKSLEDKVNAEYKPVIGWSFKVIEAAVKGRIEYRVGFP